MKIIDQGRSGSSYFLVMQPPESEIAIGEELLCRNPKTGHETVGVCQSKFTEHWADVPDSFCLLNYGCSAAELRIQFEAKYPEASNSPEVRFVMLKKVK